MDYTVSGLLDIRADIIADLSALRVRLAERHHDLQAVERVLEAIGYQGDLETRQPKMPRVAMFQRNELRLFLVSELRKGEALSSRQLAERLCTAEGRNVADHKMLLDVTARVSNSMRLLWKEKAVTATRGKMRTYLWKLAR